jgi:hypothetical protein
MNCLLCATGAHTNTTAVAVCTDCGAGVCIDHAHLVTRAARPTGHIPASGATRKIHCTACLNTDTPAPALRAPLRRTRPVVAAR